MDPDATLAIMVDESNDLDERAVAATDLLVWLANGGRPPEPRSRFGGNVAEFCSHRIFQALDRLAELEGS